MFERSALSGSLRPSFSGRMQALEVIDHKHVILSNLSLAILTSGQKRGRRKLDS